MGTRLLPRYHFHALSTLGARESVPGYWYKIVFNSHLEEPIGLCSVCTWLLHVALSDAILKHELSSEHQSSGMPQN